MADTGTKLLSALSLARRAGAVAIGFDAVRQALQKRTAQLVLLASDASAGTQKRIRQTAAGCDIQEIPLTKDQLSAVTRKSAGVLAVTDKQLAVLCRGALLPAAHHKEETV